MCVLALNIVARFLPSKTTLSASLPFRAGQSWSDPPGGVNGVSFRGEEIVHLVEDGLEGVAEIFEERYVVFEAVALFTIAPVLGSGFESSLFFEAELLHSSTSALKCTT
jgi:hypothetical protein